MQNNPYTPIVIIDNKHNCKYLLDFKRPSVTTAPVNYNYYSKLSETIDLLRSSNKWSIPFTFVANLESVRALDNCIEAKFILAGPINFVSIFHLDPQKQNVSGNIGLEIECNLRKVPSMKLV